jgi:hypothetical protein
MSQRNGDQGMTQGMTQGPHRPPSHAGLPEMEPP